jgi:hypothetical protein
LPKKARTIFFELPQTRIALTSNSKRIKAREGSTGIARAKKMKNDVSKKIAKQLRIWYNGITTNLMPYGKGAVPHEQV